VLPTAFQISLPISIDDPLFDKVANPAHRVKAPFHAIEITSNVAAVT